MGHKIKLNRLIVIVFVIIAFVVTLGLLTQYEYSKKVTLESYINKYNAQALHVRDDYRLFFDEILYRFKNKEKENIQKLNYLYDIYKKNNGKLNNDELLKELNKNSSRREYEFLLINRDYVIEKGSYSPDIGLDLGQFKGVADILQSVFDKKVQIDIASPKIDTSSMSMKRYLLKLSHDEKYLLQIAYEIPIYENIKKISEKFIDSETSLDIYIAQPFMIHLLDYKSASYKKSTFDDTWQSTKQFLKDITITQEKESQRINNLLDSSEKNRFVDVYNELLKIFETDNTLVSFLNLNKNQMICSFIANGVYSDSKDIKLIVQLKYNTEQLVEDLDKSFYLLIVILIVTMAFLIYIYLFLFDLSNKLINIVNSIKNNQISKEENIKVDEIDSLNRSYNKLHNLLNKEISVNKELLSDNKRFIADTVHQIRTPLGNIMMNSDMIKMFQKDNDYDEFIEQINASINMLTNSYEDLSYITSNDMFKYTPTELNLSEILKERVTFFESISKVNNKKISAKIEENIMINMNQIECERLIDNNISNAIKYAFSGKEIKIKLYKDKNNIVLIFSSYADAIKNPGKVFEKEYREHEAKRGLGLGLNMVKTICQKYKVTYSVTYKDNQNIFSYIWAV